MHTAVAAWVGCAFVAAVFSGCSSTDTLFSDPQPDECPGHWHAQVHLYADGERVSFDHPEFFIETNGSHALDVHLHRGSADMVHFEPADGPRCAPFADLMSLLHVEAAEDEIRLHGAHQDTDQSGVYARGGQDAIQARHRIADGAWEAMPVHELVGRQLLDCEQVILFHGPADADWPGIQDAMQGAGPCPQR